MIRCRHLNPCFPHRVVQSLSLRDRRLYVFFHACLWTGVITFAAGTGLYAALQAYAFLIMALPCICVMFVGQFGFRWLAVRNEDKFNLLSPSEDALQQQQQEAGAAPSGYRGMAPGLLGPPPPPAYSEAYEGPIFTIDGTLAPPPEYAECGDSQPEQQQQQQQQQQLEVTAATATPKVEGEDDASEAV